jgi:hypothetical protein
MVDEADILLRLCENEWLQGRQCEDQRAGMTNFIVIIAAAILSLIVQMGFDTRTLPIAVLLALLGAYGALVSAKLYERWRFHMRRARYWRNRIDELHPNAQVVHLKEVAYHEHKTRYPRLVRLRLHWLWLTLHMLITLFGVVCAIVIVTTR